MSDETRRIETLERLVRELIAEVAELRTELDATRRAPALVPGGPPRLHHAPGAPVGHHHDAAARGPDAHREPGEPIKLPADAFAGPPPGSTERPAHAPSRPTTAAELESLVGRYGTVALATLTIVMGVGAFLRWAVEHVTIGPWPRVVLGWFAAAATAALGWRLRSRGARQYGDTLLGLALALVHVVAWGAGPYLGLVHDGTSLAIAAFWSVVLALAAWRERAQGLFTVGLGGALLAPFVTTSGGGRPTLLLGYGAIVVGTATAALRPADWRVARRFLGLGVAAYVAAALVRIADDGPWLDRAAPVAFALACAGIALGAGGERHRRPLAYSYLASVLLALLALVSPPPPVLGVLALALGAAAMAMAASTGEGEARLRGREEWGTGLRLSEGRGGLLVIDDPETPWVGAIGYPVAFLGVTLASLVEPAGRAGAGVAAAFAALAVAGAASEWRAEPARRGAHVVAAGVAATAAIALALHDHPVAMAAALAALAVLLAATARRTATPLGIVPALVAVTVASAAAAVELGIRPAWHYAPFATAASFAAACATAAWWLVAREVTGLVAPAEAPRGARADAAVLHGAAAAIAVAWGREELRHAWAPELATFLLIGYYALAGVVAIAVGRRRGSPTARRTGLALAVLAALKALVQASGLASVGLRVGSYLLVGGFLLGVAWWYRGGDEDVPAPPAPTPAG